MTTEATVGGSTGRVHALAYVFWHQPAHGQPQSDYEAALADFHRALAAAPVAGLLATRALRVPELPWLPEGGYEDWYLLRTFGDLGDLNATAVDTIRRRAHDDIASRSGHGAGAVYGLSLGAAASTPGWATWLSKPRGMAYREFYDELLAHVGSDGRSLPSGVAAWRRQLVLGPAPEFCLTATQPLPPLPDELSVVAAPVHAVHTGPIHAADEEAYT